MGQLEKMVNLLSDWLRLEQDLAKWLCGFSSKGLIYKNPHQCIVGFPSNGFRSDGMLTDNISLLAVEVEAAQTHPDTNVGKYWLLHEKKKYKKIVLLHIYTPEFNSYPCRKELAEFYAEKMRLEVPFEYIVLDHRKATEYISTLESMKGVISAKLHETFTR
jgi:hypothetical protein